MTSNWLNFLERKDLTIQLSANFIVVNDKTADKIQLKLNYDLVEVRWFDLNELKDVTLIPGGRVFFQKLEYL